MAASVVVRLSREFAHPPEAVFEAWLDPATAGAWLFATPNGRMQQVNIDGRRGGGFLIVERRGAEDADHHGEYLEIDRPRRLVFAFWSGPDRPAEPSRVTLDFEPTAGGCRLTLTHEMDPQWAAWAKRTEDGWATILNGLENSLDQS